MDVKVTKTKYPGWINYPIYKVNSYEEYQLVLDWMYCNNCKPYLLSSGGNGYIFQVRKNHEWFLLRWG